MNMTKGRSIDMISSYSMPFEHLNSSISLPTSSVCSFLEAARCFFVTESADGCIDSLRCKDIVTRETLTGAVIPALGLISTVPSMRGWMGQVIKRWGMGMICACTHQRG